MLTGLPQGDRRAHQDGAVKAQVVERVVAEVRARRVDVPHPRIDCNKSILADEDAMTWAIWTLAMLVQDRSRNEYDPDQPRFERLRQHAWSLYEALEDRMDSDQS